MHGSQFSVFFYLVFTSSSNVGNRDTYSVDLLAFPISSFATQFTIVGVYKENLSTDKSNIKHCANGCNTLYCAQHVPP